jgi:hypothetical protein
MKHETYRELVGKVVWISRASRPDITYTVHMLARKVAAPRYVDLLNLRELVRYLYSTKDFGITLGGKWKINGYCDANFITHEDPESKSVSGYTFLIGGPISWSTKRQTIVALSTAEAEYLSLNHAGREAVWLSRLANSLAKDGSINIQCDNQAAIQLAENPVFHARTKHITLQAHWIRSAITDMYFTVSYVQTSNQLADIFTKILKPNHHKSMCQRLNITKCDE